MAYGLGIVKLILKIIFIGVSPFILKGFKFLPCVSLAVLLAVLCCVVLCCVVLCCVVLCCVVLC
jgi:hypothetical protein